MVTFLKESPREPKHVIIKDNTFNKCTLPIEYWLEGANSRKVLQVMVNKADGKDLSDEKK